MPATPSVEVPDGEVPDGDVPDVEVDEPPTGWSLGRKVQFGLAMATLLFWGAILGWTLTLDADDVRPPGRMDDRAFAGAAEPLCAATEADIEALGLPTEVDSPEERAAMVEEENGLLRAMLADLGDLPRPAGEEGGWLVEWLGDWDTHVEDRQRWAEDLAAGEDRPFTETARAGEQLSKGIDYFAETNDMASCVTAGDV